MEKNPSWEANRFSSSQVTLLTLWNLKVHYRIHKCPRLSLSWATSIHSMLPHPTCWRSILILSSHLRLGLPSGHFPQGFLTKTLCTPIVSYVRATCPAHLILFDLITRKILSEKYKSLRSSLCSFLHSPITSSLLDTNILLNILFWNTLSLRSCLSATNTRHVRKVKIQRS